MDNRRTVIGNDISCTRDIRFKIDDLSGEKIRQFLKDHIDDMSSVSSLESQHALDIDGLQMADVTFWTVWNGGNLLACGALKELDRLHAEIKSMRVALDVRGTGVASY